LDCLSPERLVFALSWVPLVEGALSGLVQTAANNDYFLIYQVGRGVAHDEYVEFSVQDNKIIYQERTHFSSFELACFFLDFFRYFWVLTLRRDT
jgi:hypothetical protein